MLPFYKTVKHEGNKEIMIKKSRFIGHVLPVSTEDAAQQFIEKIKKEHSSASHNCFAYIIGEHDQYQKQSDDGEPSGTAGKPILEVLKNQKLKNTVIVVTRYYGGIMLGAGGLIRAYTDGAVAAIEAGESVYQVLHQEIHIELDYTWWGKLENELRARKVLLGEIKYTDKVEVACLPRADESESFIQWLTDLTQGQGLIIQGEHQYIIHNKLEEDYDAI